MESLSFPIRSDFFDGDAGIFLGNAERGLGTVGQFLNGQIHKIAVQLGKEDAIATPAADAAGQELIVVDIDGDVLGDVLEGLGPAQNEGLAFRPLKGFGEITGPFHIDHGLLIAERIQNAVHPLTPGRLVNPLYFFLNPLFLRRKHFATNSHGILLTFVNVPVLTDLIVFNAAGQGNKGVSIIPPSGSIDWE